MLSVGRHGLPVDDVALCGGECDADLGDGASVEPVFLGIALAVYLVEGGLDGVVVFDFYDVDALWHEQRDVAAALGTRFLDADIGAEGERKAK